jgi:hypothetical protein
MHGAGTHPPGIGSLKEEERITLGKRIWQIAAEDVYIKSISRPVTYFYK